MELSDRDVLLFSSPQGAQTHSNHEYPSEYIAILQELGPCQFSVNSGSLLDLAQINERANVITGTVIDQDDVGLVLPFFDHRTGDYDCWRNKSHRDVWFFDHEAATLTRCFAGKFPEWFEWRLLQQVTSI